MWLADKWKDYEVIDSDMGEKLERWGQYILLRPDPQVIWSTGREDPRWKQLNARYHRSSKGGGSWEFFDLPQQWSICYHSLDLSFNLKPFSFKHTGLFPEQAANWEWFTPLIREAALSGSRPTVLNLFAYTGGASCAAAKAGAFVTHVDASKGMVGWARENAQLSSLPSDSIRWIVDDCQKFVEREIRRGRRYDAIIMDPPSYGRGPKGEIWKMEDSIYPFIKLCATLLSDKALFFLVNSYTTGLQPATMGYMLKDILLPLHGGKVLCSELGLPVSRKPDCDTWDENDDNRLILPCGAAGRWMSR